MEEVIQLLKDAREAIEEAKQVSSESIDEIKSYTATCEEQLTKHVEDLKRDLENHAKTIYERANDTQYEQDVDGKIYFKHIRFLFYTHTHTHMYILYFSCKARDADVILKLLFKSRTLN